MPIPGIIASSFKAGEVYYFTASETWTPPYYPFNYDVYVVGGGAGGSGYSDISVPPNYQAAFGGGAGSGFLTVQENVTVNSGTVAITIGAAGNASNTANGNAGGTSTAGNYNAAGGAIGNKANDYLTRGSGGNGGSGGASGGTLIETEFGNNPTNYAGGIAGGKGANNQAGTGQNSNNSTTGNDVRVPPGGSSGPNSNTKQTYNGITIQGVAYGASRGRGGSSSYSSTAGDAGFVIIVERR